MFVSVLYILIHNKIYLIEVIKLSKISFSMNQNLYYRQRYQIKINDCVLLITKILIHNKIAHITIDQTSTNFEKNILHKQLAYNMKILHTCMVSTIINIYNFLQCYTLEKALRNKQISTSKKNTNSVQLKDKTPRKKKYCIKSFGSVKIPTKSQFFSFSFFL